MARTLSLTYSTVNLRNFMDVADLADRVGIDLWHHETDDGRSIGTAVRWWVEHGAIDGTWRGEQIGPFKAEAACDVLRRAAIHLDPAYEAMLAEMRGVDPATLKVQLSRPWRR